MRFLKRIWTIALFFTIFSPIVHSAQAAGGEPELGRCYQDGSVFFHHVVAKLGKNRYELVSEIGQLGHGFLKAKRPLNAGLLAIPLKYTGRKTMPLETGFTAQVRQWEECK